MIDPEPTLVKVVIGTGSQHILGCLAVGDHAAVIVNTAAIAMRTGISIDKLQVMFTWLNQVRQTLCEARREQL